jgi:signal transduction histidine kinase
LGYVIGIALGWLTLAPALWLYRRMRAWWRIQRYGVPVDHHTLLMECGRKMGSTTDRQMLKQVLTALVPHVLQVDRAALLLPEDHHLMSLEPTKLRLPISHAAVRWVASAGEAQRTDRGRLRDLIQQGRADVAWALLWVPLLRGAELRGMWLLGPRDGKLRYAPEDLECLTAVARQATTALETIKYAEQEQQTATEMRALYRQVVAARELERGRLSRELHDGVLQDLCAVTRDLKATVTQQVEDNVSSYADLTARSGEAVQALRAICNDLRPPLLQHDLASALKALVGELDARSSAPISLDITAGDLRLSDDVALAIFRITQEAMHNAIQHADASEIAVRLTQYPDRLRLTVTDDGRGIVGGADPGRFVAQGHFGLAGMRERAAMIGAVLDVQTAVEYGTVVILQVSTA